MFFTTGNNVFTGLEVSNDRLIAAQVRLTRKKYIVEKTCGVKIPTAALKPSFKHLNIVDPDVFTDCLTRSKLKKDYKRLKLALPDSCCKIFIRQYNELPDSNDTIDELIAWDMANQLKIDDLSELRCSWEYKGRLSDHGHVFLVVVMLEKVIAQFETLFEECGFKIDTILPTGIGQYNFYAPNLSSKDGVAFLGLFDESIFIFVFVQGIPLFYKTLRKGLIGANSPSAMNDLDLLLQYYYSELPDLALDRIVVASPIEPDQDVTQLLLESFSADRCLYADERKLMDFSNLKHIDVEISSLSLFSAALGAARGF